MPKNDREQQLIEITEAVLSVVTAVVIFFLKLIWTVTRWILSILFEFARGVASNVHHRAVQLVGGLVFLVILGWAVSSLLYR
jgi:hypothetical protein